MADAKATQRYKILRHLMVIGPITSMEAFTFYRITRLAAVIHQLKQAKYGAWPIITEMVYDTDKDGNHIRYARYCLEQ